jgi:Cu/Ag efflux protein CusF
MKRVLMALLLSVFMPAALAQSLSDGEIRKVDKTANSLTIKHGPLRNLDMPAMTMVFQVKDPKVLDRVKVGDKVRFQAEMLSGGAMVVTRIENVK